MKKAQDFLIDAKLGEKSFQIQTPQDTQVGEDSIVLSIEENAVPLSVLQQRNAPQAHKARGNFFVRIDEWVRSLGKPKAKDKAAFFRLMAITINAGVPLIRSLDTIGEQTQNYKLKKVLFDVARSIEKGATLSDSMARFPGIFSEAQIGMIRAAEASGQLNQILRQLAIEVEKSASIRRKVRGALMYPLFIIVLMIVVVSAMMMFVVPRVSTIINEAGQTLPLVTQIVVGVSNFMVQNWVLLLAAVCGGIGLLFGAAKTIGGRMAFHWLMLRVPVFGGIVRHSLLARFCRTLSNLMKSGVPITQSLIINAKSLGNDVYRKRIELISEDVARGIPLGETLRDSIEFPPLMVQMIIVGEQTAQLDSIANKIAEYYEEEVDVTVATLSKLLEPTILVVLGGLVGTILAAIMLPILQLTQVVG